MVDVEDHLPRHRRADHTSIMMCKQSNAQDAVIAPGRRRVRVIEKDPSDNHALSAALEAGADQCGL